MKACFAILVLTFLNGIRAGNDRISRSPWSDISTVVDSSNSLGLEILRVFSSSNNAFISPISISMIIGLIYSGAYGNTAKEIAQAMQFPSMIHPAFKNILDVMKPQESIKSSNVGYTLEIANAMLVDESFSVLPSYKELSRKYFDAAADSVSFSLHPDVAVEAVNGWVAWKTHNKIPKVLEEPLDPLTKLFLMNAVYFKGTWSTKFDQRLTMPDTFYNNGHIPKTVPMMRQKRKFNYGFYSHLQAHVLELPYVGDKVKMLILLPEKRDGLLNMELALTEDILRNVSNNLRETNVQVTLPRFSFMEEHDLIPLLKRMGISSLFDEQSADLTRISPDQGIYVTKVLHKCAVEVNEEGSEATVITGVSAGVRTGGPLVPLFTADHPFLFFIRNTSLDLILFLGRVRNL
ncbi:intracellular coagulation inhibitor 1-like [Uloborus diversus]|uniref:intracellular coagulation inhibitor 1-like n=1 Tax=Uloborus diversus TaxID=327109 RepID=UPI00240A700B|nr:intracellular coagulation inhibitor 1-like [Uloborus diversus]